jgi:hypothetical protein
MEVVGLRQLILDNDHTALGSVVAQKVEREVSDGVLRHVQLEFHPEQVAEDVDVRK